MVCDHRESDKLRAKVRKMDGVYLVEEQLLVGDWIIGDHGIERKEIGDFLGSVYGKYLYRQIQELTATYAHPILVLHGDPMEVLSWVRGDAHRSHVTYISALSACARMGVPIIPVRSDQEYTELILSLIRQSDPTRPASERPITIKKKDRKPEDVRNDMLCAIDGIGRKQAGNLLKAFGSVSGVGSAKSEALAAIDGVGPKTIDKIREAFG